MHKHSQSVISLNDVKMLGVMLEQQQGLLELGSFNIRSFVLPSRKVPWL